MTVYQWRKLVTFLVVAALVPVLGMEATQGTASEVWAGIATLMWGAVIATAIRGPRSS